MHAARHSCPTVLRECLPTHDRICCRICQIPHLEEIRSSRHTLASDARASPLKPRLAGWLSSPALTATLLVQYLSPTMAMLSLPMPMPSSCTQMKPRGTSSSMLMLEEEASRALARRASSACRKLLRVMPVRTLAMTS